jgi:filamentous hemagglutinin
LAADGKLYLETSNGLTPKAGGNLAEVVDAEKNIAGTTKEEVAKLLDDANQQLEKYIGTLGKYKPPTVIGAVDPLTGKIVTTSSGAVPSKVAPELQAYADKLGGLGIKTACGNTLGRCAEFRAANELLLSNPSLKLSDIKFTPAIRPRTGDVVPRCENCTNIFGAE